MQYDYDYVIVDSKLLAYTTFHRRQNILKMFPLVTRALMFNNIEYTRSRVIWALDVQKSNYRVKLWKDYKGHREILQTRASAKEQKRRDDFALDYLKMPMLFKYLGVNGIPSVEADDMVSIVRHLRPNAKILMVSLDLDWLLNVDDKTHLLFFSTNSLYTTREQVEKKIKIAPELYVDQVSIGGQGKDNILNLQQFGKARFMTELVVDNRLVDNFGEIIDRLLKERKYGMRVNPKAKFTDWKANYHLNLLLMRPIPIKEVNINELQEFNDNLDRELDRISYEDFMLKCYDVISDVPEISAKEFETLRGGV